jgi:uncharacterized protein
MEQINIRQLIINKDYQGIETALSNNPLLANEGIPYDIVNNTKAHPLHRICDGVFSENYTDEEAATMAKIFLTYGANINGNELIEKRDTPLIAAASLHADLVALLYIENGADINHAGCNGGTALHWAAWCGRGKLVKRLIQEGAAINKKCLDFKATPLFWAVHGSKNGGANSLHDSLECIKCLIQSGADKNIPNGEGKTVFDLLNAEDQALKEQLNEN